MRFAIVISLLAASTVGLSSCAAKLKLALIGSSIQDATTAAARTDDLDLVEEAIPAYLVMLEGLLVSNPGNTRLLVGTAELNLAYGSMIELEDPQQAARAYTRAKRHALAALAHKRHVADLLDRPYEDFSKVTNFLSRKDVPVVFAAASSWGAWISTHTESMAALAELPKAILLMQWVLSEDETYMNGAPHVFMGLVKAALPPAYGGQPEVARQHFQRAYELSKGHNLMPRVLMARYCARQIFDRDLYVSLLQEVLAAPVDTDPELTLQNAAARRQARYLLEKTDAYF